MSEVVVRKKVVEVVGGGIHWVNHDFEQWVFVECYNTMNYQSVFPLDITAFPGQVSVNIPVLNSTTRFTIVIVG